MRTPGLKEWKGEEVATKALKKRPSLNDLEEMLGSKERVLFYLTWLKHDRNATKAYQELHPDCAYTTAQVNGSEMLSKIPMKAVATAFGLGHEKYFDVLTKAMDATKWNDFTGEREVDYKTIKPYHDKLGKILGIEQEQSAPNVQVNVLNKLDTHKKDYNLDE